MIISKTVLKRRRLRNDDGDGNKKVCQKSNRSGEQNNNSAPASHFYEHFAVLCTTTRWNSLILRFKKNENKLVLLLSELGCGPQSLFSSLSSWWPHHQSCHLTWDAGIFGSSRDAYAYLKGDIREAMFRFSYSAVPCAFTLLTLSHGPTRFTPKNSHDHWRRYFSENPKMRRGRWGIG